MNDYLAVGEIVSAHGVRGAVNVRVLTDDPGRFCPGLTLYTFDPSSNDPTGRKVVKATVTGKGVVLYFEDPSDRQGAQSLRGEILYVHRSDALPLGDYEFYLADLIGLHVYDDVHGDLGTVSDVLTTGANDVLVVRQDGCNDLLLPFLKHCLIDVSPDDKTMTVCLPEGLYELYREHERET